MGKYVVGQLVKQMIKSSMQVAGAKVLVLGLTFKENCPDIRNTKVVDILAELKEYGMVADIYDPWVDSAEAEHEYGLQLTAQLEKGHYAAAIVAVAHQQFKELGVAGVRETLQPNGLIYDLKYVFNRADVDIRL